MYRNLLFVLIMGGLSAVGCGGSSEPATDAATVDPAKAQVSASTGELKTKLQEIAASGAGGSSTMGIKETIDQVIRPANAKLADDLAKDLELLSRSSDTAEIKAVAAKMASKL